MFIYGNLSWVRILKTNDKNDLKRGWQSGNVEVDCFEKNFLVGWIMCRKISSDILKKFLGRCKPREMVS